MFVAVPSPHKCRGRNTRHLGSKRRPCQWSRPERVKNKKVCFDEYQLVDISMSIQVVSIHIASTLHSQKDVTHRLQRSSVLFLLFVQSAVDGTGERGFGSGFRHHLRVTHGDHDSLSFFQRLGNFKKTKITPLHRNSAVVAVS